MWDGRDQRLKQEAVPHLFASVLVLLVRTRVALHCAGEALVVEAVAVVALPLALGPWRAGDAATMAVVVALWTAVGLHAGDVSVAAAAAAAVAAAVAAAAAVALAAVAATAAVATRVAATVVAQTAAHRYVSVCDDRFATLVALEEGT